MAEDTDYLKGLNEPTLDPPPPPPIGLALPLIESIGNNHRFQDISCVNTSKQRVLHMYFFIEMHNLCSIFT